MSLYVKWANLIKTRADETWLTDGQRAAYQDILTRWPTERFVCLCGTEGCGKSFIARLLTKEQGYVYVSELQGVAPPCTHVVVDGAEYSRLMRPLAEELQLKKVVVTMRRPPRDPMPKVEVQLTERDVGQFQRNLVTHHVVQSFRTDAEGTDLGRILRAEAVHRSGINADQ